MSELFQYIVVVVIGIVICVVVGYKIYALFVKTNKIDVCTSCNGCPFQNNAKKCR